MPQQCNPLCRHATPTDIPAMSKIRLSVSENMLSDPTHVTQAMYEDFLEQSGRGWVAEHDGEILAFCYAGSAASAIAIAYSLTRPRSLE